MASCPSPYSRPQHLRRGGLGSRPALADQTLTRRLRLAGVAHLAGAVDWRVSWFGPAEGALGPGGSEATVQARCGLMEVNGRDEGRPRRIAVDVTSVAAGMLAAQAVLAAAIAGLRGRGSPAVETSALQAGLVLLSNYYVVATSLGDAVGGPPLAAPG
ncbi:MAG: CoA transferase [Acidimicrobiales bacterium]